MKKRQKMLNLKSENGVAMLPTLKLEAKFGRNKLIIN